MHDGRPEARAIAVQGQRIVGVGSDAEISRFVGPTTEVIELGGALAVPGLIEAHGHFLSLGRSMMQLDLGSAATWDEIVDMVAAAAGEAPPGRWIVGRGWHQEKWQRPPDPEFKGLPIHDSLSRAVPDNPVLLTHASGHAAMVNRYTLEKMGIGDATPDPPGGRILRDVDGRITGALLDAAADRVELEMTSSLDEAFLRRAVELATAECLAKGITSFQDAGASFAEVEFLRGLAESGELDLRLWLMLMDANEVLADRLPGFRVHRIGNGMLTVGGIKRWLDGALGSHTAWLLEPYEDLPDSVGLNVTAVEDLRVTAEIAIEHRLQLCTHAIGDRANREALDVYQEAFAGRDGGQQLRWRIEHAQHLHPEDVGRFAELGVIAAMQPVHCTSDGPWVPKRLGGRRSRNGSYLWRSLLESGAVIASGTDVPVEDIDPIANFAAAIGRRMPNGEAFHPDQAMSREQALRAATLDAAFAAFEEDIKGSLEVGKLADVTVLSRDILQVPEDEIPSARVLYTIVGGAVSFRGDP
jgi:predicted amidohydrolase YtcJ